MTSISSRAAVSSLENPITAERNGPGKRDVFLEQFKDSVGFPGSLKHVSFK